MTPISTAVNTPGTAIKVGKNPGYITFAPNGRTAYVSNQGSGTVTPVSSATNKPGRATKGVTGPIAITRDGMIIYARNGTSTVSPVSTATNNAGKPIKVAYNPLEIVIAP